MGEGELCRRSVLLWSAGLTLAAGLPRARASEREATAGGGIIAGEVRSELVGVYDAARFALIGGDELRDFMSITTQPDAYQSSFQPARYAVKLYRVEYPSVVPELANRPTVASGLVAVPDGAGSSLPMVSYQHGTVFDRSYVPSEPENSTETRLALLAFAAQGYVVIAADYFGRGSSALPDSYLVKRSTQQATYDMLGAARQVLASLGIEPGQLFLSGWSQGGWATMAFLQTLEALGETVAAAGVASGPMDISLLLNRWLNNPQPVDAPYLPAAIAMQLQAKAYYNDLPGIDAVAIEPEYLDAARDFYAGRIDYWEFARKTPAKLADFIRQEFRDTIAAGQGTYWDLLDASEVYRWRRKTPVRSWYGGKDEVTPVALAKLPALAASITGGAAFEALDAGDEADHRGIYVHALLAQKPWFDALRERQ